MKTNIQLLCESTLFQVHFAGSAKANAIGMVNGMGVQIKNIQKMKKVGCKLLIFVVLSFVVGCEIPEAKIDENEEKQTVYNYSNELNDSIASQLKKNVSCELDFCSIEVFHPKMYKVFPEKKTYIDSTLYHVYVTCKKNGHREYYFMRFDQFFRCFHFEKGHANSI